MSRKIILLNDDSSAGKSTLSRVLQAKLEGPFWHFSIDHLWTAEVLPVERIGSGEFLWPDLRPAFVQGFHHCLRALAGAGNNLIVKHIVETEEWMRLLMRLLEPFDVFFVRLHCPLPALERREKEHGDRMIGDARREYEVTNTFGIYALEVDSTQLVERNVATVISEWKMREPPSVFDRLAF